MYVHKTDISNPNCITQTINGAKVTAEKEATFLGVILDKHMNLKSHFTKLLKEVRKRRKCFIRITGSHHKPRASTDISMKILKSMIESVLVYAPVVTTLLTDNQCKQLDTEIRMCARLALHAPFNMTDVYINEKANLKPIRERLARLANNYITNEKRSSSVKDYITKFTENFRKCRWKKTSPLHVILP
jgi:hypothetical protein